jgi:hypothetical protein
MKLLKHGSFQARTSSLIDLNQLGWLATDLFGEKNY